MPWGGCSSSSALSSRALGCYDAFGVPLGRLPGDVVIRRGSATFYFPLGTSILVSVVLTVLFAILRR